MITHTPPPPALPHAGHRLVQNLVALLDWVHLVHTRVECVQLLVDVGEHEGAPWLHGRVVEAAAGVREGDFPPLQPLACHQHDDRQVALGRLRDRMKKQLKKCNRDLAAPPFVKEKKNGNCQGPFTSILQICTTLE